MTGDDPYADKSDAEVLAMARQALEKASSLPMGSIERAIQWMSFDARMMELNRRAVRHVVARIREQDAG